MYVGAKTYKVVCQVTDTKGHFILGRDTAKLMGYVNYPEIGPPSKNTCTLKTQSIAQSNIPSSPKDVTPAGANTAQSAIKSLQAQEPTTNWLQFETGEEKGITPSAKHRSVLKAEPAAPVHPTVSWSDNHITLNGKLHSLPTTKEYILREYADVFKGVGTLPGGPYHIKLKENYVPVQHAPRSVPVGMQPAYKAELDRLTKEGIIAEVHTHTQSGLTLSYQCSNLMEN